MRAARITNLPTGTITFLFTDIEGSTKRWEQHPQAMKAAVERHDALLYQAITSGGGYVFRTMGDAFCASFPVATDALSAALVAQRALYAEPWSEKIAPLKVRMALHTGIGEVRDDDYVGPPLNRVARLLATGAGGQILLSRTTCDLVRESLPVDVTLRDLGEHRLKDLQQPERVFQAVVADLPADYPPLRSLDRRPNNLPARLSSLVGRDHELALAQRLLLKDNAGLLTLTGPGGVGKTRLALQVAAELIDEFEDGAYFVDLTPVHDPGLVAAAIAQVLGVREVGGRTTADSLAEYVLDKQMLLVLDNFEHVVQAAGLVARLLAGASRLRVLATSRAALHVRGEQELAVPPLPLPSTRHISSTQTATTLDVLSRNAAVALFAERAQLVKPDFELTTQNADAVAGIAVRLDGLPLALELAAARIRLLPPPSILERLEKRLTLLTGGARDLPARQQTMRNTIAWSYELLSPEEQKLFACISVFAGGSTLEAVEVVCNPDARLNLDTFEGISALVDKSLLREVDSRGEPRFSILETIREFGLEQLRSSRNAEAVERQYVDYFLRLAPEEGREWMYMEIEQKTWMESISAEQNNLRAAIEWSLQHDTKAALRFCSSLFWPWIMRGNRGEIDKWVNQALRPPDAEGKPGYAETLLASGVLAAFGSDFAGARPRLERAISLLDSGSNKSLVSQALGFLVMSASLEGSSAGLDVSIEVTEHLVALVRQAGDANSLIAALTGLGIAHYSRAEYAEAREALEEARIHYAKGDENVFTTRAVTMLGDIARIEGDYERAGPLYERSLELVRDMDAKSEIPSILHSLGYVALARGDIQKAMDLFQESLALDMELEDKGGIAESLSGFAAVARAEGHYQRAMRLYGAAGTIRDAHKLAVWPAERAEYERNAAAIRAHVDEATWQRAWAAGAAMSTDEALEYALAPGDQG